jgi:phospholipase/carboxylesterase
MHVERLIEREKERGIPAERIVLAGFSQGGAIAYHAGLRHAEPLAGLLILSAYLLLPADVKSERAEANRGTPIFHAHGVYDAMVPAALGETSVSHLRDLGYEIDWRTYPMEHAIHPQEIADVGAWLRTVLA